MAGYRIRHADWARDGSRLRAVREAVFVQEQGVPLALEWDALDAQCTHLLAESPEGEAIGTGRLLPDGHVGRMAVLRAWRGQGVGTALLEALLREARARQLPEVVLHAQEHALPFYARFGFVAQGDRFDEAGIPHLVMRLRLAR